MSENNKVLPLRIVFPNVVTEGETFAYQLPAAYPEPNTSSWGSSVSIGIGSPQYYQFQSTAVLRKKKVGNVTIFFKKSVIDRNFVNPNNIIVGFSSGRNKKWRDTLLDVSVVLKNGKEFYKVKVPKRLRLNCLIAFFET